MGNEKILFGHAEKIGGKGLTLCATVRFYPGQYRRCLAAAGYRAGAEEVWG